MRQPSLVAGGVPRCESLISDVGAHLFAPLPRREHRNKAEQYVRGLLASSGRKTLRNVAAQDGASRQSVHHFISASPWAWMPVRQAVARYAQRALDAQAWVIRPTAIPKTGPHSIGVDQQYVPHLGQVINGQQALGAWLVSDRAAVPVDWQLLLQPRWLEAPLRRRAMVPEDVVARTFDDCVRDAAVTAAGLTTALRGPVVVDVEGVDALALARQLRSAGVGFLIRVDRETQLRIDRSRLPRYNGVERTAGQLVQSSVQLRRPVLSPDGSPSVLATIPVTAPPRSGTVQGAGMLLLGHWRHAAQEESELWLTSADASVLPALLLRLLRLPGVVDEFGPIAQEVGVRDFVGRSFLGWHHHITLASAAHLIAVLHYAGVGPQTPVDHVPRVWPMTHKITTVR